MTDTTPRTINERTINALAFLEELEDAISTPGLARARVEDVRGVLYEIGELAGPDPAAQPAAQCPNCVQTHGAGDHCLISALLGVLTDRLEEPLTQQQIDQLMGQIDAVALWDEHLGPAVDELQRLLGDA